jgi:hypothetical protein
MSEKYLPVTPLVYEAVMELQRRLQNVYGSEVSVSDTIDFLGHQSFVNQRLLEILGLVIGERTKEQKEGQEQSFLMWLLDALEEKLPQDSTCFLKTEISVPLHWAGTRWLRDIEGYNIIKCPSGPEGRGGQEYKVDID